MVGIARARNEALHTIDQADLLGVSPTNKLSLSQLQAAAKRVFSLLHSDKHGPRSARARCQLPYDAAQAGALLNFLNGKDADDDFPGSDSREEEIVDAFYDGAATGHRATWNPQGRDPVTNKFYGREHSVVRQPPRNSTSAPPRDIPSGNGGQAAIHGHCRRTNVPTPHEQPTTRSHHTTSGDKTDTSQNDKKRRAGHDTEHLQSHERRRKGAEAEPTNEEQYDRTEAGRTHEELDNQVDATRQESPVLFVETEELEWLRAQNKRLAQQVATLQMQQQEVQEALKEEQDLLKEVTKVAQSTIDDLQQRLESIEGELEISCQDRSDLDERLRSAESQWQQTERQLRSENDKLREELCAELSRAEQEVKRPREMSSTVPAQESSSFDTSKQEFHPQSTTKLDLTTHESREGLAKELPLRGSVRLASRSEGVIVAINRDGNLVMAKIDTSQRLIFKVLGIGLDGWPTTKPVSNTNTAYRKLCQDEAIFCGRFSGAKEEDILRFCKALHTRAPDLGAQWDKSKADDLPLRDKSPEGGSRWNDEVLNNIFPRKRPKKRPRNR
ncbi:hypothetical protein KVT40_001347 [Elsinoe batatas]|uniref:J domain-containing protein n=1 Tax=Elsinoe batatas TaxID=2601811 RepID=A0A8K0PJP2_9PEZI|nr:hypothetical protein KVT40_001347 [Elsinoe batatas]